SIPVVISKLLDMPPGQLLLSAISNLSLTQSFIPYRDYYMSFNTVAWSISNEAFFYLVFPFFLLWIHRSNQGYRLARWLTALFIVFVPLSITWVPSEWHHAIYYINPITRFADFALGIFMFYGYRQLKQSNWRPGTAMEVGVLGLLSVSIIMCGLIPDVYRYASYYWLPMWLFIGVFAFQNGLLSRLLSAKRLVYLGEISFAFYLIHRLIIYFYFPLKNRLLGSTHPVFDMVMLFLISLVASILLHEYIEKPSNRWLKGILKYGTPRTQVKQQS
ncbi:MAG: acyltransferase, partial [Bacteroidota bacterium]